MARQEKINVTRLQPGRTGTLVVAPTIRETTSTVIDQKGREHPKRSETDLTPGRAKLIQLWGGNRVVLDVPWNPREGFFRELDNKTAVEHVADSLMPIQTVFARQARKSAIRKGREKEKSPKESVVKAGDETRLRFMKVLDEQGRSTGITLVAETTRNPFEAVWWKLSRRGRKIAVFSEGSGGTKRKIDRRFTASDTDVHAGVRGLRRGYRATSILKAVVRRDEHATHLLNYELREVDHSKTKKEFPAIEKQLSPKQRRRIAKEAKKKSRE